MSRHRRSDADVQPHAGVSTQRVRRTISTLCALREAQAESRRCILRADRSLDLQKAYTRRDAIVRRCEQLSRRLRTLETQPSSRASKGVRTAVERNFDAGRLATACTPPACTTRLSKRLAKSKREPPPDVENNVADDVHGVAVVAPGWRVAASRITDLKTIQRVLLFMEHIPNWKQIRFVTSPHPAIPRFISTHDSHATLQNLPTWQSTRLTLIACALANRQLNKRSVTTLELERWFHSLDVHETYRPGVRSLLSLLKVKL